MGTSTQKSIALTRASQQEEYSNAKSIAEEDMDADNPTEGEIIEHISRAYTGNFKKEDE